MTTTERGRDLTPWPDAIAAAYRASGYWRGETLGELLRGWARAHGSKVALIHGALRITYRELDGWVDRMAAGFASYGITCGDAVVLQLPNVPEFVAVCFALFRLGARPVFALAPYRSSEIRHLCELSDAAALVVPATHRGFDFLPMAEEISVDLPSLRQVFVHGEPGNFVALADVDGTPEPLDPPSPSDIAFLLLSGGTTALPKLIPRTHDDYAYQLRACGAVCSLTEKDTYLVALPVEFNFPWGCPGVLGTFQAGGTVVLADHPGADECFQLIERERVTFTSLVPSLAQLWLEEVGFTNRDLSSLRLIQIGGAKLTPSLAARIEPAFGCSLQQVFGMAEGLLSFTRQDDPAETVVHTQGRPLSPADEVRIVDDTGADVARGEIGQLLARGPYTLRGYYRAAAHNARAFTPDGFFRTGDLARVTRTGDLVIEGRLKDVIIRGGDKISAAEIEQLLLGHPDVADVAVIAMPDPLLGERVCACVVPKGEPPTLASLKLSLHARGVATYKLPERLEVVAELPLTGLGKVDKKALTAMLTAESPTTAEGIKS